jgi:adenosylmethionine-8-amino-7-oxononanoate aminotransferase
MQQSVDVPDRGLRKNAVGLSGLVAQSFGVTAPGQKLVMSPPLVIEAEDIDTIVDVLHRELSRTPAAVAA